jgi:hypothetical protein
MAGGTFKLSQKKVRPGTYVNVKNGKLPTAASSNRGVGMIPLIGYDWGPRGQWIVVSAESPDGHLAELGRSVYDDSNSFMIMIQLMLIGSTTLYIYIPDSGTKAKKDVTVGSTKMSVEARYKGTLGNTIKLVSIANPVNGFDVSVIMNGSEVELFEGIEKIEDLIGVSEYVNISGSGALSAFASQTLEGATDETKGNAGITEFLDKAERVKFNCMCFPSEDTALQTASDGNARQLHRTSPLTMKELSTLLIRLYMERENLLHPRLVLG